LLKYLETLNAIHARLDRLGDLPVFSATVNRIQQISTSKEGDAMALAMAVMKDASLSTKLLKVANSSYCNRGYGKINVVSRAVVLLGFDQVKSLSVTLKLIDGFGKSHADVDIGGLLLRSFITASMTREIASKAGVDDIEETYICGLLYGLGETIVAYTLPETYQQMLEKRNREAPDWERIQLDVLGGHFSDIGQDLAQSWGFPKTVVQSMDAMSVEDLEGDVTVNHHLASVVHRLLEQVYGRDRSGQICFSDLVSRLEKSVGVSKELITASCNRAYKMVCDLADEYDLPTQQIVPPLRGSGDEDLDEFARKLAYYVHTRDQKQDQAPEISTAPVTNLPAQNPLAQVQLDYLQQIGELVSTRAPMPKVLTKVVEAIERSTGFDRAGICLLSRDLQSLSWKVGAGVCIDDLKAYFSLNKSQPEAVFFFRVLKKGLTLLVTDLCEGSWAKHLPASFLTAINPRGFVLAPLSVGAKTIGFLYADRLRDGEVIGDDDFRGFNQFFMQTKMAFALAHQQGVAQNKR
jgi:HD-like signal output (HDOD) protein